MNNTDIYKYFNTVECEEFHDELRSGIKTCCALREKYLTASFQKEGQNPRDSEEWDLQEGIEDWLADGSNWAIYVEGLAQENSDIYVSNVLKIECSAASLSD